MLTVSIQIPDIVLETHHQNIETIKEDLHTGLIIWQYLNGRLSIEDCGKSLNIGYRGFLELLWNKGIPIDCLNEGELESQVSQLRKMLDTQ